MERNGMDQEGINEYARDGQSDCKYPILFLSSDPPPTDACIYVCDFAVLGSHVYFLSILCYDCPDLVKNHIT